MILQYSEKAQQILKAYEAAKKDRIDRSIDSKEKINVALKAEEAKAISVLKGRALTTREKAEFNRQFVKQTETVTPKGTTKPVTTEIIVEGDNKEIELDEEIGISDIGSGLTNVFDSALNTELDKLFSVKSEDVIDEETRNKITAIDAEIMKIESEIAALQGSFISVPVVSSRSEAVQERADTARSKNSRIERQIATLTKRLNELKAEKQALLQQFALVPKVLDEIGKIANLLADLTVTEPLTADLKAAISEQMNLLNRAITKASELNIPFTNTALSNIGFVMNAAAFRLKEEVTTQQNNVTAIGDSLTSTLFNFGISIGSLLENIFLVDENKIIQHELAKLRTQKKLFEAARMEGLA